MGGPITDLDDYERHNKNREARQKASIDLARDKAKLTLMTAQEASQAPQPLPESITRASEMNRPDLALRALLQGQEIHIDGRPVRLADSLELLMGVPKIGLDHQTEISWQPMTATIQGFILLCKGMTDKEAVEAAAASRF